MEHERCHDITCPNCSGLPEESVQPAAERVVFRVVPAGRKDQRGADGALWRVHTFYIINDAEQIVTDDTAYGPTPILLQSVPMKLSEPIRPRLPGGLVLH